MVATLQNMTTEAEEQTKLEAATEQRDWEHVVFVW
jgi:hypothetical protein